MKRRIIGIDLAITAKHKAVVLDQQDNEFVGPVYSFRTNPAELEQLLQRAGEDVEEEVEFEGPCRQLEQYRLRIIFDILIYNEDRNLTNII